MLKNSLIIILTLYGCVRACFSSIFYREFIVIWEHCRSLLALFMPCVAISTGGHHAWNWMPLIVVYLAGPCFVMRIYSTPWLGLGICDISKVMIFRGCRAIDTVYAKCVLVFIHGHTYIRSHVYCYMFVRVFHMGSNCVLCVDVSAGVFFLCMCARA